MSTRVLSYRNSLLVATALVTLTAGQAMAQARGDSSTTVQEVVVTGSYIAGTPKDAALPVDVISSEDLKKQGSPSVVELLKALPVSSGVLGDTNQFDARAQGSEGSGSVNLRGLGSQRTLVLLNGRRMAINPFGAGGAGIVDTNVLPMGAIGRVEVLKDGAAATYGSDAIAGVVNFITKKNQHGLDVSADYKYVDGSDGDYTANANYGWGGDNGSVLLSASYEHRSVLSVQDRNWSNKDYLSNPEGGWSAYGSPGTLVNLSNGALLRDPNCASLGGFAGFSGATPVCYWHYTPNDNLVEKENRVQLYGELNAEMGSGVHFHGEVLLAHTEVPEWSTSPSYAALAVPTADATGSAATANHYYVPKTSPGLLNLIAQNPSLASLGQAGVYIAANRPFGIGGNPMFGNGPSVGARIYDAFRTSGALSGKFSNGWGWETALTYSQEVGTRTGYDTMTDRYELALRGLGGPNCNYAANTPGQNGCFWLNPFSNAIQKNAITGQVNPQYNASVANTAGLASWMFQKLTTEQTSTLAVADAVINGKTGLSLPGGDVAFALGTQYRRTTFKADYNDLSNAKVNPCINSPDFGITNCAGALRNGPFVFLGAGTPADMDSDVYAVFGELSLPVTSKLQAQLAARYEDYGGAVGNTFNPKLSVRYQATDWLVLRGSAGSTFRGPPDPNLTTSPVTSLQSILGVFRAVDIVGNPSLQPEKANTYNLGAVFKLNRLRATFDFWRFEFQDPIVAEPVAGIVAAMFPNGATGANNCGVAAYAALQSRFTFNGTCGVSGISRLRTNYVNGAKVETQGLDISLDYDVGNVLGGAVNLGANGTYVDSYNVGETYVEGLKVAPAFNAAGFLNYQTTATPMPKWKGDVFAQYNSGPHNLRVTVHYLDSYKDQRTAPFATGAYKSTAGTAVTVPQGKTIASTVTMDANYRVFLPQQMTMTVSVVNLTDEDPSFARLDLGYDPFTGNPLGRQVKVGLSKKF